MKIVDPSPPKTRLQILIKLVDEWKGENELRLRDLVKEYNKDPFMSMTKDLDFVTNQGLLKTSIASCELFIKMINQINMNIPPDKSDGYDYYYYDDG